MNEENNLKRFAQPLNLNGDEYEYGHNERKTKKRNPFHAVRYGIVTFWNDATR